MTNCGVKLFLITEDQFRYYCDFVEEAFLEEVAKNINRDPLEFKLEMKDWILKAFIALFLEGDIRALVLKRGNSYVIFRDVFDLLERGFPLVFGKSLDDFVEDRLNFIAMHIEQ